MKVSEIVQAIEQHAPLALQDGFDNAGWQVGDTSQDISGVLICLDITEEVVEEAIAGGFNLIVSHHPLIFKGIKSLTGATYVEKCIIKAIRNNIAIYSAHTNLDNARDGVNYHIAKRIGLKNIEFLRPSSPDPETISGSGITGILETPEDEKSFLLRIKQLFGSGCIKHTEFSGNKIRKVALCGGAGSFLIHDAIEAKADVFLTGDLKYHDYFSTEGRILLADFGHYESEQYTKEIICEIIRKKSTNFAVKFTMVNTNPINYL